MRGTVLRNIFSYKEKHCDKILMLRTIILLPCRMCRSVLNVHSLSGLGTTMRLHGSENATVKMLCASIHEVYSFSVRLLIENYIFI
jgi:hypothetical protein